MQQFRSKYYESSPEGYYLSANAKTKTDWAGISIADSYKNNLDYQVRLPAQKKLLALLNRARNGLLTRLGLPLNPGSDFVKMQIGPFFSNYPSIIAAHAGIGLTLFLEYKQRVPQLILAQYIPGIIASMGPARCNTIDKVLLENMVTQVTSAVQTRLILEELTRGNLQSVEVYRLFAASQNDLKFTFFNDVVHSVVLYADVFPHWRHHAMHPVTASILHSIQPIADKYNTLLAQTNTGGFIRLGQQWILEICLALLKYLPKTNPELHELQEQLDERIPPLDANHPPTLLSQGDLTSFFEHVQNPFISGNLTANADKKPNPILERVKKMATTFNSASGQQIQHEDMRTDLLEKALKQSAFQSGPLEGTPASGHEVQVDLGIEKLQTGEIYDRPLELSENLTAVAELMNEAAPLVKEMRKVLYPNLITISEEKRFCTSGTLDVTRLNVAQCSSAIFRRYPNKTIVDKGGRPVLVIACDGSGSLNAKQIRLLKILTAAWMGSVTNTAIQLIACIYHSGKVRQVLDSALVQWLYHPKKTPAIHPKEAISALISLPDNGTGAQQDSLSISYIIGEAMELAKKRMVYLILISDCQWNTSFKTAKNGQQEVEALFDRLKVKHKNQLHTTLIALGVKEKQPLFEKLNRVIMIEPSELDNPAVVAGRINLYVANCLKEKYLNLE